MTSSLKTERSRLKSEDWEEGALDMIAEGGINGVAVEPLARRLGVTKGSFYWHFQNRDALIQAALKRWDQSEVIEFKEKYIPIKSPENRLRELFLHSSRHRRSNLLFRTLSAASDHALVAPVLARVSERRLATLISAFKDLGMGTKDAENRARLTYAAYIGMLQLNRHLIEHHLSRDDFDDYLDHMIKTLIPSQFSE